MEHGVVLGGLYRHYKGGLYRVITVAKHSETLEKMVVYVNENDPTLVWARPASMWNETVSTKDGDIPRFSLLEK